MVIDVDKYCHVHLPIIQQLFKRFTLFLFTAWIKMFKIRISWKVYYGVQQPSLTIAAVFDTTLIFFKDIYYNLKYEV